MNRSIYVHNVGVFVFSVLLGFFLLGLANSFIGHMTPDISICLLYTQTFLETWNRFRYSYDSKGIVVIWMLLPFVRLFGPNMIAAAMAQMVAYGIGLLLVHRILRGFLGRLDSLIVVLAGGCLLFSHFIWGGNVRADDFGFAFAAITVYGMWRMVLGRACSRGYCVRGRAGSRCAVDVRRMFDGRRYATLNPRMQSRAVYSPCRRVMGVQSLSVAPVPARLRAACVPIATASKENVPSASKALPKIGSSAVKAAKRSR